MLFHSFAFPCSDVVTPTSLGTRSGRKSIVGMRKEKEDSLSSAGSRKGTASVGSVGSSAMSVDGDDSSVASPAHAFPRSKKMVRHSHNRIAMLTSNHHFFRP